MDGVLVRSNDNGWRTYERDSPVETVLRPLWSEMHDYCWFYPFSTEGSPWTLATLEDDEEIVEEIRYELAPHSVMQLYSSELILNFTRYLSTDYSLLVGLRGAPQDYLSELGELARMVPDAGVIAEHKGRKYPVKEQAILIEDFLKRKAELIVACYDALWIAVLTRREDFLKRLTKARYSMLDELYQVQIETCDYSFVRKHFGRSL